MLYQDAWAALHPGEPGWTWARANPYTGRLAFLQPDRRLDYIFVTPERRDGRGRILDCRIVFDQPSPAGVWASDHFGVLAEVQIDARRVIARQASRMFRLAHVTDPHFRSLAGRPPRAVLRQAGPGLLNLVVNRRRKHRMELLDPAARGPARARRRPPGAHRRSRQRRARVGVAGGAGLVDRAGRARRQVTVIPGNHDTYVADVVQAGSLRADLRPLTRAPSSGPGPSGTPSSACATAWR